MQILKERSTMQILTLGAGFTQPTTIEYTGTGDCKAIARWSCPPLQSADLPIGVVAFHKNGIDRVEFSANNGSVVVVTKPSKNPHTNVWEYFVWVNQDDVVSGQLVEVRATIYPTDGIPRVLQGSLDGICNDTPKRLSFRDGHHSIFVTKNEVRATAWVAVDGNDTKGTGTITNPYATIQKAASKLHTQNANNASNCKIFLKAGEHSIGGATPNPITSYGWLTIESGSDFSKDNVSIINCTPAGLRTKFLRFHNVKFDGTTTGFNGIRTNNMMDSYLWVDRCDLTTSYPTVNPNQVGGLATNGWMGVYATESCAYDTGFSYRPAQLVRNCVARNIGETPIGGDATVINFTCDNYIRFEMDHADMIHWFWNTPEPRENRIIYGLNANRFSCQSIYTEPLLTGAQRLDNLAIVNYHHSKGNIDAAGSWITMDFNHLLLWNMQLPDQVLRIKDTDLSRSTDGILQGTNLDVRNCIFFALIGDLEGVLGSGTYKHIHLLSQIFGFKVPVGEDITKNWEMGNLSVFVDAANANFKVRSDSAASDRVPLPDALTVDRLDGDISTAGVNLGTLLSNWGTSVPESDLNKDGVVDAKDLSILISTPTQLPLGAFI